MVKNVKNNGTKEIGLVTPTPDDSIITQYPMERWYLPVYI